MTTGLYNVSKYSRFNLSSSQSDITVFVKDYGDRILKQLAVTEQNFKTPFHAFAEDEPSEQSNVWIQENYDKYMKNTKNQPLVNKDYLSELGFICSMAYAPDGSHIVVGHSTGYVELATSSVRQLIMAVNIDTIIHYSKQLYDNYNTDDGLNSDPWYPMFYDVTPKTLDTSWVLENDEKYIKNTLNRTLHTRWFLSEMGAITAIEYSRDGSHLIVGHASGLIQMRHGSTGVVLCTLRNMQFPPKPIYAISYSRTEERVCYAACMDGIVYRIEIPNIETRTDNPPDYCIRADPALESLKTQFYGSPGIHSNATPFLTQRCPAQALGITADSSKIIVGYADASVKLYDIETQDVVSTYKVHKLRLQFIPKKLQRMHAGQVCAVRCHDQETYCFASAAWDQTLRVWDTRCQVGCMMTFEGVNVINDSIDLNRDHCIAGSWLPSEALTLWDLKMKKRISILRIQNRRPDVDGEYLYACKYWRSTDYNRKGKYAIIGGSGTNCVEVINLHNRYISCSYPAAGNVLSIASHQERIAFGGTATVFNIVAFHDPKHEKYDTAAQAELRTDDEDYYKPMADYEDEEIRRMSYILPEKQRSKQNIQRIRISTAQANES